MFIPFYSDCLSLLQKTSAPPAEDARRTSSYRTPRAPHYRAEWAMAIESMGIEYGAEPA